MDKNGKCFEYLAEKFPKLSDTKIEEGVLNGPQIRKLFNDEKFVQTMKIKERLAWTSFEEVYLEFLGNKESHKHRKIVGKMAENFKKLGCLMIYKIHCLDSHLDEFPENVGDFSEEQGERFHQDLKDIEKR